MEKIDQFLEDLLDARGITHLEPEAREEIKAQLKTELLEQIDRAAINELSSEQVDELSKKMDDPNFTEDQVYEYILNSGVDVENTTLETILKFRDLYLGVGVE